MSRLYSLIVTALLTGHALAQEPAAPGPTPPADPNLWFAVAAGVTVILLLAITLKRRKSKQRLTSPAEKLDTTPVQPKKKIENPITLKQQKPDAD